MKALVVYESFFGDARAVAEAIADGLRTRADDVVGEASVTATDLDGVDPLVVGAPTHQLGLPRKTSRRQAVRQHSEADGHALTGLREWMADLRGGREVPAAAFDTRLAHPALLRRLDHAGRTATRLLCRHGCRIVAAPEAFYVASTTGPLIDGELTRARAWGRGLAVASTTYDN